MDEHLLPRSPKDYSNLGPVLHTKNVLGLIASELIPECMTQDDARDKLTYGEIHKVTIGPDGKVSILTNDDSRDMDDTDVESNDDTDDEFNDDEITIPSGPVPSNNKESNYGECNSGLSYHEENIIVQALRRQSEMNISDLIGEIVMTNKG